VQILLPESHFFRSRRLFFRFFSQFFWILFFKPNSGVYYFASYLGQYCHCRFLTTTIRTAVEFRIQTSHYHPTTATFTHTLAFCVFLSHHAVNCVFFLYINPPIWYQNDRAGVLNPTVPLPPNHCHFLHPKKAPQFRTFCTRFPPLRALFFRMGSLFCGKNAPNRRIVLQ
jgi:hypothetical protein